MWLPESRTSQQATCSQGRGHPVSLGLVQAVGGLTLHRHPAESPASSLWVSPGDFSPALLAAAAASCMSSCMCLGAEEVTRGP